MKTALTTTAVIALVALVASPAWTAGNSIPPSKASLGTVAQTYQVVRPTECNAITIANVVIGSGTFSGSSNNDLMLGRTLADTISGGGGADCILGGAGNDSLRGDQGSDICIGGPGTDTFTANCEVQIQ